MTYDCGKLVREIVEFIMSTIIVIAALLVAAHAAYRLPRDVVPIQYDLEIITFLGDNDGNFSFDGKVWIQVEARKPADVIVLHAKDLKINHSQVTVTPEEQDAFREDEYDDSSDNLAVGHNVVEEHDFYIVQLLDQLVAGKRYRIYIPFSGDLSVGLAGYYRSSYQDRKTGQQRWLSVTQFEAIDARRAFPCFDEPDMKARFNLSLGRMEKHVSISNMPLIKTEPMQGNPGWFWDRYETSKLMSTYLLAYVVSDLQHRDSDSTETVLYRIWARPDAIEQTDFALKTGPKLLKFFENYFDYKYPLPKLDMVAIPDFGPGAMENWGIVTYRESALLYDPEISSIFNKQGIASVIAHELAHQWFGNLVTMKWWTDLWLNEGFATYVATIGVDQVFPEWNIAESNFADNLLTVFTFDALQSSHPISTTLNNPHEISQIFDIISYKKGAVILRMMSLFLGNEVFRKGVSQYLKKHEYGNAKQDDLWASLTDVAHSSGTLPSNLTVKEIMDTWTLQTGYPVITVERDYDKGTARITQRRYVSDTTQRRSGPCWYIPLSYTTEENLKSSDYETKSWFKCDSSEVTVHGLPKSDQWIIFNLKMTGLYRVLYDVDNWELLRQTLSSNDYKDIDVLNRVQIINDVMNFAWTGEVEYDTALSIMDYLILETEYLPWKTALNNLNVLNRLLRRTLGYGPFRVYAKKLLTPIYQRRKNITDISNSDDIQNIKLHNLLVSWACRLQIGDCVEQSRQLYKKWMQSKNPDVNNPIPQELRATVYCTAIRYGGEEEWNFAWDRYLYSNLGSEKNILLSTLGCTREVWLINRYLEWSLNDDDGIRKQDSYIVFSSIARSDVGFHLAKDFFMKRIADIHRFYGPKTSRLSRYIAVLADQMYHELELQEFTEFLSNNEGYLKQSLLSMKQALESVKINIQWHTKHYVKFNALLVRYGPDITS